MKVRSESYVTGDGCPKAVSDYIHGFSPRLESYTVQIGVLRDVLGKIGFRVPTNVVGRSNFHAHVLVLGQYVKGKGVSEIEGDKYTALHRTSDDEYRRVARLFFNAAKAKVRRDKRLKSGG